MIQTPIISKYLSALPPAAHTTSYQQSALSFSQSVLTSTFLWSPNTAITYSSKFLDTPSSDSLPFKDIFFLPFYVFPSLRCHRNKPGQEVTTSCPCKGRNLFCWVNKYSTKSSTRTIEVDRPSGAFSQEKHQACTVTSPEKRWALSRNTQAHAHNAPTLPLCLGAIAQLLSLTHRFRKQSCGWGHLLQQSVTALCIMLWSNQMRQINTVSSHL